ncbi:hypothetical protein NOF04DRAFT_17269 [Fusarium oxysporum II5]|uniref:Uncharacterized protein n=2 Tax=Fusarium oxysporum species complex TaxID=171631 RepID=X0LAC9_FUSO5|nr:uncharacterized protein FOIG_04270 [Fusarium odoratissimum NRRL 54006]EXM05785.1 hypothetical protein FOIG_04270 [Fusarium odoratissimum NRRL 54006]KAK2125958.1 hypothetical protein NOF04DRAFT_17269 [Fusarium oxysporum II5]TXB99366.1 hypothetical protein FocTR4_00014164 [Fusarium oxysporum f. sp. cubense]
MGMHPKRLWAAWLKLDGVRTTSVLFPQLGQASSAYRREPQAPDHIRVSKQAVKTCGNFGSGKFWGLSDQGLDAVKHY